MLRINTGIYGFLLALNSPLNTVWFNNALVMEELQWISHRCSAVDMVKVWGVSGCEGRDECRAWWVWPFQQWHTVTTSTWHQPSHWLTCLRGGRDKSLSASGAVCQRSAINVVVLSHSIKMQSAWLIVVSCASRQDHRRLFSPFTWCWAPITLKVNVMLICSHVCTWCRHGKAEKFKQIYLSNLCCYWCSGWTFNSLQLLMKIKKG